MAWTSTEWACGHTGSMQLYGKGSQRNSKVACEAGRQCMACWLVSQWDKKNDPRAQREDRYQIAADIAEGKGIRLDDIPDCVPVVVKTEIDNPLAKFSLDNLLAEIERRK